MWRFLRAARRRPWLCVAGACLGVVLLIVGVLAWLMSSDAGWVETQRALAAEGVSFDDADLTPAPIPDGDNFAAIPVLAEWAGPSIRRFWAPGFSQLEPSMPSMDAVVARVDWAATVRTWDPRVAGKSTGAPLATIETLLAPTQADREELIQGLARPGMDPKIDFRLGTQGKDRDAYSRWYARINHPAVNFWLHALARLEAGDTNAALVDVAVLLRLRELAQAGPVLALVSPQESEKAALELVWYGLATQKWTRPQRAELRTLLARNDRLAETLIALKKWRIATTEKMAAICSTDGPQSDPVVLLLRAAVAAPAVLAQMKTEVTYSTLASEWAIDLKKRIFDDTAARSPFTSDAQHGLLPWVSFMRSTLSFKAMNLAEAGVQAQAVQDLARTALALEDWREEKGAYPATLAELEGYQGFHLPHDVYGGGALHYRREPEGRFTLYSAGIDGKDDGGLKPIPFDQRFSGPGRDII